MSTTPFGLTESRHLQLVGRGWRAWARRGLLALVVAIPIIALFNVFGQRPHTSSISDRSASLVVNAPTTVRGGLLYTASFRVTAHQALRHARLLLDPGWIDGMQVNSTNPEPASESSDNGRLALTIGPIAKGRSALYFIEFQVDPTTVGRHRQNVELDDGTRALLTIRRSVTILP
jgi:hypothetical protein